MGPYEITVMSISAALAYFLVASLTARLFNWTSPRSASTGVFGLLWPVSLPIGLVVFVAIALVVLVEWGAGLRDFGREVDNDRN